MAPTTTLVTYMHLLFYQLDIDINVDSFYDQPLRYVLVVCGMASGTCRQNRDLLKRVVEQQITSCTLSRAKKFPRIPCTCDARQILLVYPRPTNIHHIATASLEWMETKDRRLITDEPLRAAAGAAQMDYASTTKVVLCSSFM